jgi:hypothetical protein
MNETKEICMPREQQKQNWYFYPEVPRFFAKDPLILGYSPG